MSLLGYYICDICGEKEIDLSETKSDSNQLDLCTSCMFEVLSGELLMVEAIRLARPQMKRKGTHL